MEWTGVPLWALRRAHGSRAIGFGASGVSGRRSLGELAHKVLEIRELLNGVAVDLDQAVVRRLLGVFVDETAREDGGHLGTVEGLNLVERSGARDVVAPEFRQAVS